MTQASSTPPYDPALEGTERDFKCLTCQLVTRARYTPRACPGTAQWVAEGDGAAVHVDSLGVQAQLADARQRLAGEGFVELHQADPLHVYAGPVQRLATGRDRPQAHTAGVDPGHGGGDHA